MKLATEGYDIKYCTHDWNYNIATSELPAMYFFKNQEQTTMQSRELSEAEKQAYRIIMFDFGYWASQQACKQ